MMKSMRKHMKTVIIGLAVVFIGSMFWGLSYKGFGGKAQRREGAATVNGKQIDLFRLNDSVMRAAASTARRRTALFVSELQVQALASTINFEIMLQEAKKHFGASGGEIDAALEQMMNASKIPSRKELELALKNMGTDIGNFKRIVGENITVQKMIMKLQGEVTLNPDDLREVRASHILIMPKPYLVTGESDEKKAFKEADDAAKALAESLLNRIKSGEDFAKLARQYSDDPGSKDKGGDLGFFSTGMMVPEFDRAVFALKPGELSGVVKTPYGYHIIKLLDTKLKTLSEEDKGKDIREVVLEQKKRNAVDMWMRTLQSKAKVEIINPILKANNFRVMGMYDEAIAEFNSVLAENSGDPNVHLFLGDAYENKGDIALAIAEYLKATQIQSYDPDLFIALGKAYKVAGRSNDAVEQYKKASTLAAEDTELRKEIADLFKDVKAYALERAEREKIRQIESKRKLEEELRNSLISGEGGVK